ncbi:methyltransferase [Arenibaculum pallidiluteum]|uniref:methyltransferase n=1 Tax=Arenibaculum pallidiluteum TaxID=2812559 RepID=UPI001A9649B0|nr:methyltransferase [Arenibaculum pallidiluteum]
MDPSEDDGIERILELMSGHAIVRSIAVAADLGIPDRLSGGPVSAETLAAQVGADAGALLRLLRALAAVGLFSEDRSGRFGLTPVSARMRSDVPGSLRDFVRLRGSRMYWEAWAELPHAIATGQSAFSAAHGMTHFPYLEHHPADARLFGDGMQALSAQMHEAILDAYDFPGSTSIADVGGGRGGFLAAILRRHAGLSGVLLETAAVAADARAALAESGVGDRIQVVAGDFFAGVPQGSDAILLSRVLHNWGDEQCQRILANCRAALPAGGRVLIVEFIVADGPAGRAAKLFDLQMLVYMGAGRERTEAEMDGLVRRAGFEPAGLIPTRAGISVYTAVAA